MAPAFRETRVSACCLAAGPGRSLRDVGTGQGLRAMGGREGPWVLGGSPPGPGRRGSSEETSRPPSVLRERATSQGVAASVLAILRCWPPLRPRGRGRGQGFAEGRRAPPEPVQKSVEAVYSSTRPTSATSPSEPARSNPRSRAPSRCPSRPCA